MELDERTKREDAHNARLREVLEGAIAFYHAVLTKLEDRARPRCDYLRGRGFTDETIDEAPAGLGAGRLGPARRASWPRKRQVDAAGAARGAASPARASAAAACTTASASA